MRALRLEAPVVVGMVGLNPEARVPSRPEFDDAGLVVGIVRIATAIHGANVMPSDRKALDDGGFRRPTLCHDDIRAQEGQFPLE